MRTDKLPEAARRQFLHDSTRKALQSRFATVDVFLQRWNGAQRKDAIIKDLPAEGLPLDLIADELGNDLDPFDLICHIAFTAASTSHARLHDAVLHEALVQNFEQDIAA